MSGWNGTQSNPARPVLQCQCCSSHKQQKNGSALCDNCVTVGCAVTPWKSYKSAEGCVRRAKHKRQAARYVRRK